MKAAATSKTRCNKCSAMRVERKGSKEPTTTTSEIMEKTPSQRADDVCRNTIFLRFTNGEQQTQNA
jgi:hypothetical protein